MIRPAVQLVAAFGLLFFGAALIGLWAVGLALIVLAILLAVDAVLRDAKPPAIGRPASHDEILERWRRAR